ncbi:MAG: sigma-70 family RNA polymerase sigma factor [Elusimicrobiota bacterium]
MEPLQDTDIIRRVRSGERQAYAELVRKYQGKVRRLCASILSDTSRAEDAAQEVFIKAYRSLADFQALSAFSTWLYRIASRHCLDLLRKEARQRTESWDALVEAEGESIHKLLDLPPDPERSLEDADLVRRVLSHLPADYRMVLVLRELQRMSYDEIAEALDCSLDAVKARLRRARRDFEERLRHFLEPDNV